MHQNKYQKIKNVFVNDEYNVGKVVTIILMIFAITFILTPRYDSLDFDYIENDIAISDIIVEEDMLLEDEQATELKKENLIQNLGLFFKYQPGKNKEQAEKIILAFAEANKNLMNIENEFKIYQNSRIELIQNMVSLKSQVQQINRASGNRETVKNWLQEQIKAQSQLRTPQVSSLVADYNRILSQVLPAESYRQLALKNLNARISQTEKQLEAWRAENAKQNESYNAKREKVIRDFATQFQILISETESRQLLANGFSKELGDLLASEARRFEEEKIIDDTKLENFSADTPIYIKVYAASEDYNRINNGEVLTLNDIRNQVDLTLASLQNPKEQALWQDAAFLLKQIFLPSLVLDKEAMEARRKNILETTSPVYISLKKGNVIASRGTRLDIKNVKLINQYYKIINAKSILPLAIGIFLITTMMFLIIYLIFRKIQMLYNVKHKYMVMLSIISVIHLGINYGVYRILQSLSNQYGLFHVQEIGFYALPISLAPMLLAILTGFEVALVSTIMIAVLSSFISSAFADFFSLFYVIFSGIFAAYTLGSNHSRIDLLIQGLKVSLFNVLLALLILLFRPPADVVSLYFYLLAPLVSGVLSALFAMFVYPFLEAIFDITTDLKLLELSNINHPLLKNLMSKAPGSYQHSIMVGNLAEAGALKIGANSLLCRVAAYYHDIGKTMEPQYFIENLGYEEKNIHDDMNDPYESTRQIISHVTEGEKLARKHRLGKAIIDIIQQHHGNGTVNYFYHKAQEQAEKEDRLPSSVSRQDFRYPGPRPQTIEAAIVMLADSCEASARSLKNPTKENIEKIIYRVGKNLLGEGQLDYSGISLKDFQSLIKTFNEMLVSLYHKRVSYPHQDEAEHDKKKQSQPDNPLSLV